MVSARPEQQIPRCARDDTPSLTVARKMTHHQTWVVPQFEIYLQELTCYPERSEGSAFCLACRQFKLSHYSNLLPMDRNASVR